MLIKFWKEFLSNFFISYLFYLFECDTSRHWTILDTSEWWLEVTDTMPEPMTSLWLSQTHQHHDQPRDIDQNESRKLWCDDKAASRYCNVFGFWMILNNCSEDLCHVIVNTNLIEGTCLDSMVKARHQSSASFQHPPLTRPLTARQAWKQAQLQPSLAFAKLNSVRASVCWCYSTVFCASLSTIVPRLEPSRAQLVPTALSAAALPPLLQLEEVSVEQSLWSNRAFIVSTCAHWDKAKGPPKLLVNSKD